MEKLLSYKAYRRYFLTPEQGTPVLDGHSFRQIGSTTVPWIPVSSWSLFSTCHP